MSVCRGVGNVAWTNASQASCSAATCRAGMVRCCPRPKLRNTTAATISSTLTTASHHMPHTSPNAANAADKPIAIPLMALRGMSMAS